MFNPPAEKPHSSEESLHGSENHDVEDLETVTAPEELAKNKKCEKTGFVNDYEMDKILLQNSKPSIASLNNNTDVGHLSFSVDRGYLSENAKIKSVDGVWGTAKRGIWMPVKMKQRVKQQHTTKN